MSRKNRLQEIRKAYAGQVIKKLDERFNTGMNGQYVWKRTEETEIDLMDLLQKLCIQWKQIVACALVFALFAGGFAWMKNKDSSVDMSGTDLAEETELTEEEYQSVVSAAELYGEIKGLEEYLDSSVLMQADPYHKHKVILLYSIDETNRQNVQKIVESYLSFLTGGGAVEALRKSGSKDLDIDKTYLSELISAYQRTYASPYQVVIDNAAGSSMPAEALFYAEVTGLDENMAEQLAGSLQSVLKAYSAKVNERAGSHKLVLLEMQKTIVADSSLQVLQHDKRTQLSANRASLKAMTDTFNREQLDLFQKEAAIADEQMEKYTENRLDSVSDADGQLENQEDAAADHAVLSVKKYIFLGLAGGIFVYICFYVCWYLFRDTVKSAREIKEIYVFPFYGEISFSSKTASGRGKNHESLQNHCGQADVQLLNRIRMVCRKQGITKLCAASDFLFREQEKECMEKLVKQLGNYGIDTVITENAAENTVLWDTLAETGNVLMVCRLGTTTHRMIDDCMRFYTENGISVIGAMAFE